MTTAAVRHPGEFRWETRLLAVVTLMLTAMGIATCYASSTYQPAWFHEASQQLMAAVLGGVLFLVAARMDYRVWRRLGVPLLVVTVAGLVPIAIVALIWKGRDAGGPLRTLFPVHGGAHRWIKLGVQIQVSEIARFTLVIWLAGYAATLGAKVRDFGEGFLPLIGVTGIACALVAVEPSRSMAGALGAIGLAVVFTAGARVPHLLLAVLAAAAIGLAVLKFGAIPGQRLATFKAPTLDCNVQDQGCNGLIGFGAGGAQGVGFGSGTQKYGRTPEAYSDYLLSVIGEEWGFIGVTFVTLCFGVFCWMGFRIARTAADPFGTNVAAGLTAAVGVTALLHAAVVTKLAPATGLTLPFMSVGRVSLLVYLVSAGVIVSIGRQRGRPARSR